jgi:predicted DNA binding CopG/RHH family protein
MIFMTTKSYTSEQLEMMQRQGLSKTDWQAIDSQPIQDNIDDDFNIDDAELIYPKSKAKKQIAFRLEADLLEFLKHEAQAKNMRGYQSLMHSILETYKQQRQKNR